MLSGIKDKILNVSRNVNLFNERDNQNSSSKQTLNVDAGAPILQHFEEEWVEIHKCNEENAEIARNISNEIKRISRKIHIDKQNIDTVSDIIENSKLCSNITKCGQAIQNMYITCENIEQALITLEDVLDQVAFKNMQEQHRYHLEQYKMRKKDSFESLKVTLEERYQQKIAECEENKNHVLEERQKVFQEAFKNDIELYKNLGTLPKIEIRQKQNGALLEEIQIDYDQSELDKFFDEQ